MHKRFLSPSEVVNSTINIGIKKSKLPVSDCLLLGILAGVFIGLGGLGNILVTQTLGGIDVGLAKLVGASVFPIGLMLVVICGAELFTGNNLMTLALLNKKINISGLMKNWVLVYVGNFIGSVILVLLVFYSGVITGDAISKAITIAESKVALTIWQMVLRGVLCNILVTLAVWMSTASQDIISKIFACWFPIMLFVLCGFEHSVANMFFIPLGMILGAKVTIGYFLINLLFVTIGNIIGGAIIIPFIYNKVYK